MKSIDELFKMIEEGYRPDERWNNIKQIISDMYDIEIQGAYVDGINALKKSIVDDVPYDDSKDYVTKKTVRDVY